MLSPSAKTQQTIQVLVDILMVILVSLPGLILLGIGRPTRRGFFCDDESIRYPYNDTDTISSTVVAIVCITATSSTVAICEILHYKAALRRQRMPRDERRRFCCCNIDPCMAAVCGFLWTGMFGALATYSVTEIGKYSIGRLRPNFVSGCRRNISLSTCVTGQYMTDFTCLAVSMPSKENFLRTSFPSGYASSSAFSMIYVICYIQCRVAKLYCSRLFKHFLQFVAFSFVWICGLSSVIDHKHHATDVLAGWLIGGVIAVLCVRYIANNFSDPYRVKGKRSKIPSSVFEPLRLDKRETCQVQPVP